MPSPSKTSRAEILAEAIRLLEEEGSEALSLRALARHLDLATNALYYYFDTREALEAAVAVEGWRRLLHEMIQARGRGEGTSPIRRVTRVFVRYALAHPALYKVMMDSHPRTPEYEDLVREFGKLNQELYGKLLDPEMLHRAPHLVLSITHGLLVLHEIGMIEQRSIEADAEFAVLSVVAGLRHLRDPRAPS